MRHLKFKLVSLSLIAVLTSVLAFQASRPLMVYAQTKPARSAVCKLDFGATVRQGPSANTTLAGTITLNLATDGSVTGQVTEQNGTQVMVAGQIIGRAISIALQLKPFDLSKGDKGSYIFGNGVAFDP